MDNQLLLSSHLYENFMQRLIALSQQANFSLSALIEHYLTMNSQLQLEQSDKLKAWLDEFRPFDPTIVAEL